MKNILLLDENRKYWSIKMKMSVTKKGLELGTFYTQFRYENFLA